MPRIRERLARCEALGFVVPVLQQETVNRAEIENDGGADDRQRRRKLATKRWKRRRKLTTKIMEINEES